MDKIKQKAGSQQADEKVIAIAGNPNVGKSTVFNSLTGMKQHTGNWPGKTVTNARGRFCTTNHSYVSVDIPGTYSLMAHSAEEEAARNFICFGDPDVVIAVCDATCLERNMNLVLQITEISKKVILCVNLMDEAKRRNIRIDLEKLSEKLNVPVVGTTARKQKGLKALTDEIDSLANSQSLRVTKCQTREESDSQKYRGEESFDRSCLHIEYIPAIEEAIAAAEPVVAEKVGKRIASRWLTLRLLDPDESLLTELAAYLGYDITEDEAVAAALSKARKILFEAGIGSEEVKDKIVAGIVCKAEKICGDVVSCGAADQGDSRDRRIDRILTGRITAYPIMLMLLALVFWITLEGANYPSRMLSWLFLQLQNGLTYIFQCMDAPEWLHGMLVLGVYRVLAWVVAVMLPPMAIFFPLFTLLEDAGYLPRIAYNLDKQFKRCKACGKQALTMCMGFGCNAVGVTGCRIIDSPRERLIAMLTNCFVPCNGRFPTLIAIITMFFVGTSAGFADSLTSALILTAVILLGISMTFIVSGMLSKTILKGVPSSFTLELPAYRRPQIGKVIVRSIFDRTLFVLGRAVTVAAPAGLVIWVMANVTVGGTSLLGLCAEFLDPFARLLGLDGIILIAFILGFPANEIVFPIIIMAYMSTGSISDYESLASLKELLIQNGWTWVTAVSTVLFSLMHWPCSTTLITIKKESGSLKWTAAAFAIPTAAGFAACFLFARTAALFI